MTFKFIRIVDNHDDIFYVRSNEGIVEMSFE